MSFVVVLVPFLALLAVLVFAWLAPTPRGFALRMLGAAFVVSVLVAVTYYLWKPLVLVTVVSSCVALGLAVAFQRLDPYRAIGITLGMLAVVFFGIWAALQLTDLFLYDKSCALSKWVADLRWYGPSVQWLLTAVGVGLLVSALSLEGRTRAIAFFGGTVLCLAFGFPLTRHLVGYCGYEVSSVSLGALFGIIAAIAVCIRCLVSDGGR